MDEPNATRADLCDRLARGPLVLDGATGTELTRRGVDTALPLWSAAALTTAPGMVQKIHRDYVEAGADIVVANTFRTNVRALRRAGRFGEGAPDGMGATLLGEAPGSSVSRLELSYKIAAPKAQVLNCLAQVRSISDWLDSAPRSS